MLSHRYNIVFLSSSTIVNHTSLHSRTERAYRILLHTILCSFDDGIRLYPIGHAYWLHIFEQWLWFVLIDHRINSHCSYLKFDWCHRLEILQNMDQAKRVFTATEGYKYSITIFNHFEISNGCSYLSFDIFWNFHQLNFCRFFLNLLGEIIAKIEWKFFSVLILIFFILFNFLWFNWNFLFFVLRISRLWVCGLVIGLDVVCFIIFCWEFKCELLLVVVTRFVWRLPSFCLLWFHRSIELIKPFEIIDIHVKEVLQYLWWEEEPN